MLEPREEKGLIGRSYREQVSALYREVLASDFSCPKME